MKFRSTLTNNFIIYCQYFICFNHQIKRIYKVKISMSRFLPFVHDRLVKNHLNGEFLHLIVDFRSTGSYIFNYLY